MSFTVRLTAGAARDLEEIYDWVSANRSPDEAAALLDALTDRTASLAEFPRRGSVPPELERLGMTEFRQVPMPPYRIIYRVIGDTVFILVIADGATCRRTSSAACSAD